MLRTPTFQSRMARRWLLVLTPIIFPVLSKADVDVTIHATQSGDEVTADVLVSGFTDILSIQFALEWDPNEIQFEAVENFSLNTDPLLSNFGVTQTNIGILYFAWPDMTLNGQTLPECGSLFRVRFTSLNGQISPITVSQTAMLIEVYNVDGQEIQLTQNGNCATPASQVNGKVFWDTNINCTYDDGEFGIENWTVILHQNDQFLFYLTNVNGEFSLPCLPGVYELSVEVPTESLNNNNWTVCQTSTTIEVGENQTAVFDFAAKLGENPSSTSGIEPTSFSATLLQNPIKSGREIPFLVQTEKARLLTFFVFDASGKLLHQTQSDIQAGTSNFSIQPSLVNGLYLLRLSSESGESKSMKLVVY